jgi:hypothetical protein
MAGGARHGKGKQDPSFSEENEAKRPSSVRCGGAPLKPGPNAKVFWFFFQKRTLPSSSEHARLPPQRHARDSPRPAC